MKATRPQAGDMPDLIKPEGWTAPSHKGNHGTLPTVVALPQEPMIKKTRSKKLQPPNKEDPSWQHLL